MDGPLAVCDVVHYLPIGDVDKDILFTEDQTWRNFSYLSGTLRECIYSMHGVETLNNVFVTVFTIFLLQGEWLLHEHYEVDLFKAALVIAFALPEVKWRRHYEFLSSSRSWKPSGREECFLHLYRTCSTFSSGV